MVAFRSRTASAWASPLASDEHFPSTRPVLICNRHVTTADGARLYVTDYKPSTPEHTVVLLHGLCLAKATWAIQFRQLIRRSGDTVRIIAYDHRGHGESSGAPIIGAASGGFGATVGMRVANQRRQPDSATW
jgi:pimeloyl-ACP methyl ester carboxylesterase